MKKTSQYKFDILYASESTTGIFHFEINGIDISGTIAAAPTGGWQTWIDRAATVSLENQGEQVVKVVIEVGGRSENVTRVNEQNVTNAIARLLRQGERYLVFLHGTTWPTKHWPEAYWGLSAGLP